MGLLTPLAVRIGRIPWLPRYLPQIVWVDLWLQRLSGGRVTLLRIAGLPNLVLTVTGRKSGRAHLTPLLCVPVDGGFAVAGSNFGSPTEPAWALNLLAAGRGSLSYGGVTREFTSHLAVGEERTALWRELLGVWPNFALYEQRTTRTIKVFRLTPTG
ncbi:nitroreductase family deazaflavin-dependent oxidoreductase [Nakamurella panacisegetis]|nr:nitroreductase family deazaflavin-dependent oxidoreductase [Nakamurella panacisegetis]